MAESLFRYVASPSPCGYLPEQRWSLEYEYVASLSAGEYLQRMLDGWRHFGHTLFRPACPSCTACRPVRICVDRFHPDRSQRRVRKANEGVVPFEIRKPSVSRAKLTLYDRFHDHQSDAKGWPRHPTKDSSSYLESFVQQPFVVEEWNYAVEGRLVGVGYVDPLASIPGEAKPQGGLSAIYYFWEPDEAARSLGTWNVLCLIDEARRRGLPYVYLGYYVAGCPSMEYKIRFAPNEIREPDGTWRAFRE